MKVDEVQKSTASQNEVQMKREPFFSKEGNGSFFSKSNDAKTPFFSQKTIQPKLTIGQPKDKYEIEADAMADQVVQRVSNTSANNANSIQTKCSDCEQEEQLQKKENDELSQGNIEVQQKPIFESNDEQPEADIQTKCNACEEKEKLQKKEDEFNTTKDDIQEKSETSQNQSTPDLQSRLNATKGGGSPLSSDTQNTMGNAFGADFSNVKIHRGSQAIQMNKDLGAQAFTHGNNIYFNQGKYDINSRSGKHLLAHELTHTIQQKASRVSLKAETDSTTTNTTSSKDDAEQSLIVDDTVTSLEEGQMTKSSFIGQLKAAVCKTTDNALAGTGRTSEGCPYIERWLGYYSKKSGKHLEQAIQRFTGKGGKVTKAQAYIPLVTSRVKWSVAIWAVTGKVMGVPEGLSSKFSDNPNEPNSDGTISPMAKSNTRNAKANTNPGAVKSSLGKGTPLNNGVKTKMETAFGENFGHVRTHTDGTASKLSDEHNARAFTLGNHIAFNEGEYQPGTLLGDALIAHELAHVVQQNGSSQEAVSSLSQSENNDKDLENDADQSAMGAMMSLWGKTKGSVKELMPKLRSGVKLQRCAKTVKRCPKGKSWQVMGDPAATGPVCWCVWKCLPDNSAYSSSSGPAFRCPPRQVCSKPKIEYVDDNHTFRKEGKRKDPGTEIGPGGHMSPLGGQAMCGCIPLDIEGGEKTGAPLRNVGLDVTNLTGMRGKSRTTGLNQPGGGKKSTPPSTGKKPPAIVGSKTPGKKPPVTTNKTPAKPAVDYKKMPISKHRKLAKTSPEAANALLDRYKNNMGLKRLKDKYNSDKTAKALLDEYYDKTTASLKKLEKTGDKLAKQVLDDLYGVKDSKTGGRPYLEEKPSNPQKTSELKGKLPEAREKTGIERKELRRELKKKQLEGGTIGVGDTDIPGLDGKLFEGKSPRAGGKADPTFKPPSDDVRAKGHAEQNLTGKVDAAIQKAVKAKKMTLGQLEGKTVRFHIEQEVCSVCRQGLNPGSTKGAGVLKQFSKKYPSLTIEVTASGTSEVIRIKNGQIIRK